MPVPIAFWLPEPAPVLMASGSTPSPKASEVMRMGRSRWLHGMHGRLHETLAAIEIFLGKLDDQDRVLCRKADDRQQADLEINSIGHVAQVREEEHTQRPQRHVHHHGKGNRPALVQAQD